MIPVLFPEVSRERVIARLEVLLPGFTEFALRRAAERRAARTGILSRLRPDWIQPEVTTESEALYIDSVLEFAEKLGLLRARTRVAEDFEGVEPHQLASVVLDRLPDVRGEVLVVSHRLACYCLDASALSAYITRDSDVTGDCSLDGDEIFVCTTSPRVVATHHSGWVFTIGAGG